MLWGDVVDVVVVVVLVVMLDAVVVLLMLMVLMVVVVLLVWCGGWCLRVQLRTLVEVMIASQVDDDDDDDDADLDVAGSRTSFAGRLEARGRAVLGTGA